MTHPTSLIALYLDGPLQSWGNQSRFDRRTTLSFPTRSGIIGLLSAALGIDREDSRSVRRLDQLQIEVIFLRSGKRLEDFHTVGGGYDSKREKQKITRTAEGKTGNVVVTRRHYVQESRFCVFLRADSRLLEEIAEALENPRWGIWLGRKNCIPASPVFQGFFTTEREALEHIQSLALDNKPFRIVREVDTFEEGTDTLLDRPLNFARREFAPRRIVIEPYSPD